MVTPEAALVVVNGLLQATAERDCDWGMIEDRLDLEVWQLLPIGITRLRVGDRLIERPHYIADESVQPWDMEDVRAYLGRVR